MAQIYRRTWKNTNGAPTKSAVYYCRFQINGRDYVRSTGKTTERAAIKLMKDIMRETQEGAQVQNCLNQLKRAISELPEENREQARRDTAAEILKESAKKLRIEETWQTWLDHPGKRTPGKSTLAAYIGQWKRFAKWAKEQNLEFLHEIDEVTALSYATDLKKSGISPRTYNAHIKLLRSVFKTLSTLAGLTDNFWNTIALDESSTEGRRNLTPNELQTVCTNATDTMRYLFGLGIYTGMRLGDCVTLKWSAVDFDEGFITHMPSKTKRKKRQVRIPLHPILTILLKELLQHSKGSYLFPKERVAYNKDSTSISKRVQAFYKDCGIKTQEIVEGRKNAVCRVGFHSLRHSFVTLCAMNRVPLAAVMELVGHGSPAMTALYSHAGDEGKAKAVASLPALSFNNPDKTSDK
jgi:integrase